MAISSVSNAPAPQVQPAAAPVDKDDGNFKGAIDGDKVIKPGGRGGISGDVFVDEAEKAKKTADSGNNIGGDDLFT